MKRALTESEKANLDNALTIARERFQEHINALTGATIDISQESTKRLREQFERQLKETAALQSLFASVETIETAGREAFVAVVYGDNSLPTRDTFAIGLAEEDKPGYALQSGFGKFPTYEAATAKARELNRELGLSDEDAACIIGSSMYAQNRRRRGA